jgi:hypothetical protein
MKAPVALPVTDNASNGHIGTGNRVLRHAALRIHIDLNNAAGLREIHKQSRPLWSHKRHETEYKRKFVAAAPLLRVCSFVTDD